MDENIETQNTNNFLVEFEKLLIKYNAEISFTCSESSDTMGLSSDTLILRINKNLIKLNSWECDKITIKDIIKRYVKK
jgi:hypothetical protein